MTYVIYNKFRKFPLKNKIEEKKMTIDPFAGLGFLLLLPLILLAVFYIIAVLIAVWVYKDAKKRDMNAAVWLLITLLTGCIGCIVYLVVRD